MPVPGCTGTYTKPFTSMYVQRLFTHDTSRRLGSLSSTFGGGVGAIHVGGLGPSVKEPAFVHPPFPQV